MTKFVNWFVLSMVFITHIGYSFFGVSFEATILSTCLWMSVMLYHITDAINNLKEED